jgi:endonuclease/exonuclease/phosphatase family metal-dependent hydrolase
MPSTANPAPPRRRRWLLLAALPALAALTAGAIYLINRTIGGYVQQAREKRSFRIMTWNIGKLYLRWDSRAADADLAHVAEVIREVNPQVVALQELRGPTQLGRLASALGPEWRAKVPRDSYDRRAGLLVRVPAEFLDLNTSTGRTAQGALLTLRDGVEVLVASVHLDAFDPRRRRLQAEEVLAGARRLGDGHLFLAGDFNFDPSVAARGSSDQRLYSFLTSELKDAARHAGGTTVISRRLDYVFYRSTRVRQVSSQVLRDRRINIMDHDPVVVEFYF